MPNKPRRGFTIVELAVAFAIMGVLVALIIPAVLQAREAARNLQCKNNLRQIGIALLSYREQNRECLPLAAGTKPSGWVVALLPFLDQTSFVDALSPDRKWWPDHISIAGNRPLPFTCPSRFHRRTVEGDLPVAHYGFNAQRLGTAVTMRSSNVVMISEVDEHYVSWIEGPEATSLPNVTFHRVSGGNCLFTDGSVHFSGFTDSNVHFNPD